MVEPYYSEHGITIYHGDGREILPSLPVVDLVATDPPYAFGRQRPEWRVTASIAIVLALAATKVRKKGAMAVMAAASGRGIEYVQGAVGPTLPFNRLLIWHKSFVHSPVAGPWRWDIVPVLLFGRASFGRPILSSCYTSNGQWDDTTGHPSALPTGIGTWLVGSFKGTAATVLDPFCGTGVFLTAAKAAGMTAVGVEIEERWCEAAANRLRQEILPMEDVPDGLSDLALAGEAVG